MAYASVFTDCTKRADKAMVANFGFWMDYSEFVNGYGHQNSRFRCFRNGVFINKAYAAVRKPKYNYTFGQLGATSGLFRA